VAEQRYQAVLAVISDGLSNLQVGGKVGVSRQTLHSWLRQRSIQLCYRRGWHRRGSGKRRLGGTGIGGAPESAAAPAPIRTPRAVGRLFDSLMLWAWQLAPSWLPRCRGRWPDSGKQGRAPLLSGPTVPEEVWRSSTLTPSAASAMRAAEACRPDVVFGPYGSGPALAAAAAAASKGVVWNHGGATARLARPAYPRVVNGESPAYRYLAAVLETLVAEGLGEGSEVVIMHVDTGFGREVAEGRRRLRGDLVCGGGRSLFGQAGRETCWRKSRRAMCCYRPVPSTMTSPSHSGAANAVGVSWIGRRGGR
jgi:hypothetical protein